MLEAKRYLGLELSGARNPRTALAVLEYFPKERKLFLLDLHDKIEGDEALLNKLSEVKGKEETKLGMNAAFDLPPCITCTRKSCPLPESCTVTEVKAMRDWSDPESMLTPYTQRPVEIWLKTQLMPHLPKELRIEFEETLGANKAPLTTRLHFLKKHLLKKPTNESLKLHETHAKLSTLLITQHLGLPKRTILSYRKPEQGIDHREEILDKICETFGVFVYDKDFKTLSHHLNAFDAFISALTLQLMDLGAEFPRPKKFPKQASWIVFPSFKKGRLK
jgi:hypothetical protein